MAVRTVAGPRPAADSVDIRNFPADIDSGVADTPRQFTEQVPKMKHRMPGVGRSQRAIGQSSAGTTPGKRTRAQARYGGVQMKRSATQAKGTGSESRYGAVQREESTGAVATGSTGPETVDTGPVEGVATSGGADEQARTPKAKKFKAGVPATFAIANSRHIANIKRLKKMLDTGKSQKDSKWGKSWPNACQWLLAGKTSLHAVTETHDSQARAAAQGKPTMRAFFGINRAVPNASSYTNNNQAAE